MIRFPQRAFDIVVVHLGSVVELPLDLVDDDAPVLERLRGLPIAARVGWVNTLASLVGK